MSDEIMRQANITVPYIQPLGQGGGGWPLRVDPCVPWAYAKSVFTPTEVEAISELGERLNFEKARTSGPHQDDEIRNSKVCFIFPGQFTSWIFERLTAVALDLNAQFFGFDLWGFDQGIQFTRYEQIGHHYDWHVDRGPGMGNRKLSLVVQLSDPSTYEGGSLEFLYGSKDTQSAPRDLGSVTVFPSFAQHRVAPLESGSRESLVAWIGGPPFR